MLDVVLTLGIACPTESDSGGRTQGQCFSHCPAWSRMVRHLIVMADATYGQDPGEFTDHALELLRDNLVYYVRDAVQAQIYEWTEHL